MNSYDPAQDVGSLWNTSQPDLFHMRGEDLAWNFQRQSDVKYWTQAVAGVPSLLAVASQTGASRGLSARSLWLCLWDRIPQGREASYVQALLDLAKVEGKSRLSIGGDEFHFIAGLPEVESSLALQEALKRFAFHGLEAADYVGSVQSTAVAAYIQEAQDLRKSQNLLVEEVQSHEEKDKLEKFIEGEFPGRWLREYRYWRSQKVGCATWLALRDGDRYLGFSRIALRSRLPMELSQGPAAWLPAALRLPLGDPEGLQSDSCLGPIGVAASARGRGAGRVILAEALSALRSQGADRLCIDWTDAHRYYEPLGFSILRKWWIAECILA